MIPWKLIVFLIILAVFVLFAGFNVTNSSDISFGFTKVKDVPIFISLFISFLLGAFVMLPFAFAGRRRAKKRQQLKDEKEEKKQLRKLAKKAQPESSDEQLFTDTLEDENPPSDS